MPEMEESTLRSRLAGEGCKPPSGASVKSRGAERDGKGGLPVRQVWAGKASESDPLMTCRKFMGDIKTEGAIRLRDEPGGYLSTAQVVSGIKVARAWSGLWCGTWEPVVSIVDCRSGGVCSATRQPRGRTPRGGNPEVASTDARHRGGPSRRSVDAW